MKIRTLLVMALAAVGVAANAQLTLSYNDLDQVRTESGLVGTPGFGVNQEFEAGFAAFSGGVADDVTYSGNTINRMAVAMEFSVPGTQTGFFNSATGWIIRHGTIAQLAAGTASSTTIGLGTTTMGGTTYGTTSGHTFEITGLNISVTAGANELVSIVPILNFSPFGQTFIMSNNTPLLGGGANSWGYNPGNGFGLGTSIPVNTNAALSVNTVPEPATLVAIGAGLAAFARRRRNSK